MVLVDAHLDLGYCALRFGRDVRLPVAEIRARESGARQPNGTASVSLPALRSGGVGLVFASLFGMHARYNRLPGNERLLYTDSRSAAEVYRRQLDFYRRLADDVDYVQVVTDRADLSRVLDSQTTAHPLLGLVPAMEGAEAIQDPAEVADWFEMGVRLIGPAWMSNRYVGGGWEGNEDFSGAGHALLEAMAELNLILDLTHLSDKAIFTALTSYPDPIVASHCNSRALVDQQRQLSDTMLLRLAERGGVTGIVLANSFLKQGHARTDRKADVTVDHVVAHVDHICQLTGSADHVGIGSDMDGGFGAEQVPAEIDSSADLPKIGARLAERGFEPVHIEAIMGGNWLRVIRAAWSS